MPRTIRAEQIDFGDDASTLVVSDSLRFVLPVPALAGGGEPLDHPDGGAFLDRDGRPIQGRGVVFFDPDDASWEVASGDGTAVILISPVDEAQGARLGEKVASLADDPARLTLEQIKAVLRYAIEDLGVRSTHASTRAFVAAALTPVARDERAGFGLHRRRADDPCRAVFVSGQGQFLGPAASPQVFTDGAVILRHGRDVRLVQRDSFEKTYRFPDGRPARVKDLARQRP
ncbi:MAG TPA: hypothetical protein VG939_12065 [Caulobacteraceae bacterium]|nr:hypothetical protein [Caulobacteraceae bacterium]